MTWNLEDIERDWTDEKASALAASPDSVVAAFNHTERDLRWERIEKSRISVASRGVVAAGIISRPNLNRRLQEAAFRRMEVTRRRSLSGNHRAEDAIISAARWMARRIRG
jgi:hypothetical protein